MKHHLLRICKYCGIISISSLLGAVVSSWLEFTLVLIFSCLIAGGIIFIRNMLPEIKKKKDQEMVSQSEDNPTGEKVKGLLD